MAQSLEMPSCSRAASASAALCRGSAPLPLLLGALKTNPQLPIDPAKSRYPTFSTSTLAIMETSRVFLMSTSRRSAYQSTCHSNQSLVSMKVQPTSCQTSNPANAHPCETWWCDAAQKLSWIRKAAQKLSQPAAKAAAVTAGPQDTNTPSLLHLSPKRPPADTDAEQQCPRPPVDIHPLADVTAATDISPSASPLHDDVSEPSPAVLRLRALRLRATSPEEAARKRRSALRCAAPDSASSLNSARGARAKDPAVRRRNYLAGMDLGAILLSPDKAACLASASCKVRGRPLLCGSTPVQTSP